MYEKHLWIAFHLSKVLGDFNFKCGEKLQSFFYVIFTPLTKSTTYKTFDEPCLLRRIYK
jgi:hypothetical protein